MDQEINKQRIENIAEMILQIADGNFAYRIPRTGINDKLEGLIVIFNWTAEDLQQSIFHSGFVNPRISYKHIVESILVVDDNCIIKGFNANASSLLGFIDSELLNVDFTTLLLKESVSLWESASNDMQQNESFLMILLLEFLCVNKLIIPASCSISRLYGSTDLHISFFSAKVTNMLKNSLTEKRVLTAEEQKISNYLDVRQTQAVYDYVLAHMDSALPTIKELSRLFGTNQNKLKSSFKHLFNMTINQFYNSERLNRSHILIQQSKMPLQAIANTAGFSYYPNFSRAFKIKFGYSPRDVEKESAIK
jgi:AraC-like DNA-binding protein